MIRGNDRITTTIHWYWFKLMGRWWSAVSDETKPGPVGVPWYICGNNFLHVITKLCGNTSNKNTVTKDFPCRIGVGIHGEKDCNQTDFRFISVTIHDQWGEQRQMWVCRALITCRNHHVYGQKKSKEPTTTSRVMKKGTLKMNYHSREYHLQLQLNSLVVVGHRVGDCMVSSIDSALLFDWFGSIVRTVRGSFIYMCQSAWYRMTYIGSIDHLIPQSIFMHRRMTGGGGL